MRSQSVRTEPEPRSGLVDCIYVLAAVATPRVTVASPAEVVLRQALGEGDGEVLLIDRDAANINRALQKLTAEFDAELSDVPLVTPRETDVLSLVGKGLRTREIAEVLHVSSNTVNTHLKNVFRKLGVRTRSEAVFEATRLHIIQPC